MWAAHGDQSDNRKEEKKWLVEEMKDHYYGVLVLPGINPINAAVRKGVCRGSIRGVEIFNNRSYEWCCSSVGYSADRGCRMAAEDINKKGGFTVDGKRYKVKIVTYDNKYNPSETISAVNRTIFGDR